MCIRDRPEDACIRLLDSLKSTETANPDLTFKFSTSDSFPSYLTEQKEREKKRKQELKEQGIEVTVKKKPKHVESHFDDCGEDLTSLGEVSDYFLDEWSDSTDWTDDEEEAPLGHRLLSFAMLGSLQYKHVNPMICHLTTMEQAFPILMQQNKGDLDVVELCGGEGRTSQLALRRKSVSYTHLTLPTICSV